MQLTEEQIQSNLKAYEHAMRTGKRNDIETKSNPSERAWWSADMVAFHIDWIYRIRPTPRLRPWKPEEVPVGAIYRAKGIEGYAAMIVGFTPSTVASSCYNAGPADDGYIPFDLMFDNYEHSTDGGKTWLPCGVMEEGE